MDNRCHVHNSTAAFQARAELLLLAIVAVLGLCFSAAYTWRGSCTIRLRLLLHPCMTTKIASSLVCNVTTLAGCRCVNRVMTGASLGAALGGSIGTKMLFCSLVSRYVVQLRKTYDTICEPAGAVYGTYEAFQLKVCRRDCAQSCRPYCICGRVRIGQAISWRIELTSGATHCPLH